MHPRTYVLIAAGTALLTAAAVPITVFPALAQPTDEPPHGPRAERLGVPGPPGAKPQGGPPAPELRADAGPVDPGPVDPGLVDPGLVGDEPVGDVPAGDGPVSAAALLSKVSRCRQISNGLYRTRESAPTAVPVCDANGAVFWKADMDIDCDGQVTDRCNKRTDPYFQSATSYTESSGRALNAKELPYIVVPTPSRIWNYRNSGISGGSVAAVIHGDRVQYAVVGDTGPPGIIGEGSFAAARGLGIATDPSRGGVGEGVTYILFKDSQVPSLEDQDTTARQGEELAKQFLQEN
ncbi:glycoside hydrolase family 75 protein [Streptomyces sp. GMY02]|uniref:glycoside hydrolase family 75 protein n=1 Tax=Streptomyces sp. GMY02 TaxID=1333528 RepID=UPI001C2CA6AA|nr:glycoside hydrolase family 75 protein [Streptomyces sp. GMY02]QXE38390.1 glycoside hydrolase family 75 protein [Streptomyces sp. GMY02]